MVILARRLLPLLLLLLVPASRLSAAVPAPDFTLPNYAGGSYHLAESRGKEVVVVFAWASW